MSPIRAKRDLRGHVAAKAQREAGTCGKSPSPSLLTSVRRPAPFLHTVPKDHITDVCTELGVLEKRCPLKISISSRLQEAEFLVYHGQLL